MEKGMERGMERGMEKGRQEGLKEVALNLLKSGHVDIQAICKATGLSKQEVSDLQKGMEKGMERGMERGMEKGRQEGLKEVALNLLKSGHVDIQAICKATGLSKQEVSDLQKA